MTTRMVRAHPETLERLKRMQRTSGSSMADLLARAVELLERATVERKRDAAARIGAMRADVEIEPAELRRLIDEGRGALPGSGG